ncbi:hypothetical protein [Pantoea sp. 18069]|uniref:hypothetical protein n=1 Tax=Pantoea sp. 18069 TaxID=2681415 RepID=UPI001359382D|nr:hypothetical protein [Pantoea sp. 18069]
MTLPLVHRPLVESGLVVLQLAIQTLYPVRGWLCVGAGDGNFLDKLSVRNVAHLLAVEAERNACARLLKRIEGNENWSVLQALISDKDEEVDYYRYFNANESGLLTSDELVDVWKNLPLRQFLRVSARSLSSILENEGQNASYNWLTIDCLPAVPLLKGLGSHLNDFDVVQLRVTLVDGVLEQLGASYKACEDFLVSQGFKSIFGEEESNSKIGKILYLRDWKNSLSKDKDNLVSLFEEDKRKEKSLFEEKKEILISSFEEEKGELISSFKQEKIMLISSHKEEKYALVASLEEEKCALVASLEEEKCALVASLEEEKCALVASLEEEKGALVASLEEEKGALVASLEEEKGALVVSLEEEKCALLVSLEAEKGTLISSVEKEKEMLISFLEEEKKALISSFEKDKRTLISSFENEKKSLIHFLKEENNKDHERVLSSLNEVVKRLNDYNDDLSRVNKSLAIKLSSIEEDERKYRSASDDIVALQKSLNKNIKTEMANAAKQIGDFLNLKDYLEAGNLAAVDLETNGWPASSDFMLYLVRLIENNKYDMIIEFGSGTSTLVVAKTIEYISRRNDKKSIPIFVSFDHLEKYFSETARRLKISNLEKYVKLVHAPLKNYITPNGESYSYYDCCGVLDELKTENEVGIRVLAIIDGPPAATQKHARYPAGPIVFKAFEGQKIDFLLDDASRKDEKEISEKWKNEARENGYEFVEEFVSTEKGAFLLKTKKLTA